MTRNNFVVSSSEMYVCICFKLSTSEGTHLPVMCGPCGAVKYEIWMFPFIYIL